MAQSEARRRAASGPVGLSPRVLEWALADSGMDATELAERAHVTPEALSAWISGDDRPNRTQFAEVAKELARPEEFFFLPEPPRTPSFPAELRTAADGTPLTHKDMVAIRRARHIQSLVSWIVEDAQQPPESVMALRSIAPTPSEDAASERFRDWLGLPDSYRGTSASGHDAFNRRREAIEQNGIIVMQQRLGRDGFRGFSIADAWVPMIVINRQETPEARSFTLMHELSHLAVGGSSSCAGVSAIAERAPAIERQCDRIASRILIPREDLLREMSSTRQSGALEDLQLFRRISRRFRVSLRASAIALIDQGAVHRSAYGEIERTHPATDYPQMTEGDNGPRETRVEKRVRELGRFVIHTIIDAERRGRITERDVLDYLNLDRDSLPEIAKAVGGL